MRIEINNDKYLEVNEENLIVKDKRLYNKDTKQFEGVNADIVSFELNENGKDVTWRGTVDGYTNGSTIKLRGIDKPFKNAKNVKVEHISVVTSFDLCEENLEKNQENL